MPLPPPPQQPARSSQALPDQEPQQEGQLAGSEEQPSSSASRRTIRKKPEERHTRSKLERMSITHFWELAWEMFKTQWNSEDIRKRRVRKQKY